MPPVQVLVLGAAIAAGVYGVRATAHVVNVGAHKISHKVVRIYDAVKKHETRRK